MKFTLGAMSVGEILDRGLRVLLRRLPTFYALAVIVLGPQLVLELVGPLVIPPGTFKGMAGIPPGAEETFGIAMMRLAGFAFTALLTPLGLAAAIHIVSQDYLGEPASLGSALKATLPHFLPLLATTLLVSMLAGAVWAFSCCVGMSFWMVVVVGLAASTGGAATEPATVVQVIILLLVLFAALVPPVMVLALYGFFGPAVVMEERAGLDALARSKDLGEGSYLRIVGVFMLLALIFFVFYQVAPAPFELLWPPVEQIGDEPGKQSFIFHPENYYPNRILTFLVNVLPLSYILIVVTLLYFDLRVRKEGFDLELAARKPLQTPTADRPADDGFSPPPPRRLDEEPTW